jgi:hypothetical protein
MPGGLPPFHAAEVAHQIDPARRKEGMDPVTPQW